MAKKEFYAKHNYVDLEGEIPPHVTDTEHGEMFDSDLLEEEDENDNYPR